MTSGQGAVRCIGSVKSHFASLLAWGGRQRGGAGQYFLTDVLFALDLPLKKRYSIERIYKKDLWRMVFMCYPRCGTCQKARAWLDGHGLAYDCRDIKENNPTYEELKGWYEASGLPLKRFFNTSGLQYKSQRLKDRLPGMSEEEQLALLASDGMLVKRPILLTGDRVLVGFKEAEYETLL